MEYRDSNRKYGGKRAVFVFLLIFLYASWSGLKFQQWKGEYFKAKCQKFQISFEEKTYDFFNIKCCKECKYYGKKTCPVSWNSKSNQDKDVLQYQSFNDNYGAEKDDSGELIFINDRLAYRQRDLSSFGPVTNNTRSDKEKGSPPGRISYCKVIGAWVFSIDGIGKMTKYDKDAKDCNWLMKSKKTKAYLLEDVPEENWEVWTGTLDEVKVDKTCLTCKPPENEKKDDAKSVRCTYHGKCDDQKKECECDKNWMGAQCETCTACSSLEIGNFTKNIDADNKTQVVESDGRTKMLTSKGNPLKVYGRPVHVLNRSPMKDSVLVILYTGSRYMLWSFSQTYLLNNEAALINYMKTFHSTWDDLVTESEPLFESELTKDHSPINLDWFVYTKDRYDSPTATDFSINCVNKTQLDECKT